MRRRAKQSAQEYTRRKDRNVVTCLDLLYETCATTSTFKQDRLSASSTIESGFDYLYSRDGIVELESDQCTNAGSMDDTCVGKDDSEESPRDPASTLRGLEGMISPDAATDRKMDCIHAVLRRQSKLQEKESFMEKQLASQDPMPRKDKSDYNYKLRLSIDAMLAKESAKASASSRRFARLLGKVDESMVAKDNRADSTSIATSLATTQVSSDE